MGRGTDFPYHQVGAPWLDVHAVLALLPTNRLPGVQFLGVKFTPEHPADGKYGGVPLRGIRMVLTDPRVYDPTLTAVMLLVAIHQVHPDSLGFRSAGFDRLAGGSALRERIQGGAAAEDIVEEWQPARDAWLGHRRAALLYP